MLQQINGAIDAEIANQKNDKLGIRFSHDLFNALVGAKMIEMTTFSLLGTGAFSERTTAYRGKYYAILDFDLEGHDFRVGVSN